MQTTTRGFYIAASAVMEDGFDGLMDRFKINQPVAFEYMQSYLETKNNGPTSRQMVLETGVRYDKKTGVDPCLLASTAVSITGLIECKHCPIVYQTIGRQINDGKWVERLPQSFLRCLWGFFCSFEGNHFKAQWLRRSLGIQ